MKNSDPCRLAAINDTTEGRGLQEHSGRGGGGARPGSVEPRHDARRRRRSVATLLAALFCLGVLGGGTDARAQVTMLPVNKCLAGKLRGTGKYASLQLGCFVKAFKSSSPTDAVCLNETEVAFTGGDDPSAGVFGQLEAMYPPDAEVPCLTFDDASVVKVGLWDFEAAVLAVTGNSPGRCDAGKVRCVAKYVTAALKCNAKAAAKDGAIDPECREKAVEKLTNPGYGCPVLVVSKHDDCTNNASQAAELLAVGDAYVEQVSCILSPGNAGCP